MALQICCDINILFIKLTKWCCPDPTARGFFSWQISLCNLWPCDRLVEPLQVCTWATKSWASIYIFKTFCQDQSFKGSMAPLSSHRITPYHHPRWAGRACCCHTERGKAHRVLWPCGSFCSVATPDSSCHLWHHYWSELALFRWQHAPELWETTLADGMENLKNSRCFLFLRNRDTMDHRVDLCELSGLRN